MTADDNTPIPFWPFVGTALGFLLLCLAALWLARFMQAAHDRAVAEYEAAAAGVHHCEARKGNGRCGRPDAQLVRHPGGEHYLCRRCAHEVHALTRGWTA